MRAPRRHQLALALVATALAGCVAPPPPPAAESFRGADPGTAAWLTRRIEATDEPRLLRAIGEALHDLGYVVTSAESSLGIVVAIRNGAATRSLLGLPITARHVDRVTVAVRPAAGNSTGTWRVQTSWHRTFPDRPEDVRRGLALHDDAAVEELFAAIRRHLDHPAASR